MPCAFERIKSFCQDVQNERPTRSFSKAARDQKFERTTLLFYTKVLLKPPWKSFYLRLVLLLRKKKQKQKPHSDPLAYYWFYCYVTYWIATIQGYLLCNRPPSFIPYMELLFDLQSKIIGHFEVEQGPGWSCTFGLMPSLRDPAVHDESPVACHF